MIATPVPKITVAPHAMKTLLTRHPWVRPGSVESIEGEPTDGEEVDLYTHKGRFLARGIYNSRSRLRVRLYRWDAPKPLDGAFWEARIDRAIALREILGLTANNGAARLIYSEADGLSGLILDRYGDYLVLQVTSLGVAHRLETIGEILFKRLRPKGILLRTDAAVARSEGLTLKEGLLRGEAPPGPVLIEEHGITYGVDLQTGHKTGFYLDQRENRAAARYLRKRRVLDVFCYTGGFSLAAARLGGAGEVLAIDSSDAAVTLARLNARQNAAGQVTVQQGEAFDALEAMATAGQKFGGLILDPPKFAPSKSRKKQALKAYHWLNRLGVSLLEPGGVLVTCSCSGSVSQEDFVKMLFGVAQQTRREIQILEARGAAPDHPVAVTCRETDYLKCCICRVD